jgi:hypothetical protein
MELFSSILKNIGMSLDMELFNGMASGAHWYYTEKISIGLNMELLSSILKKIGMSLSKEVLIRMGKGAL